MYEQKNKKKEGRWKQMMKKMKNVFYTFMSMAIMFPTLALAFDYGEDKTKSGTGMSTKDIPEVIADIIKVVMGILGAVAVLLIVVAGIMYMTSGGDEGRVEKAKNWIIYAIVGLVVAILGYAIVSLVTSAFA